MLRIEPIDEPFGLIRLDPAIVPNAGKLGIADLRAACGEDGVIHIARAAYGNGIVAVAVERPDGDIGQAMSKARNACAANGNGCREQLGVTGNQLPRAVAAHGDTAAVYAGKVDLAAVQVMEQERFCRRKSERGLFRERFTRARAPCVAERDPFVNGTAGTLGRDDDGIVTLQDHIDEAVLLAEHADLLLVVNAAFSVSVKEEENGVFLVVVCVIIRGIIDAVGNIEGFARFGVFVCINLLMHDVYVDFHIVLLCA